MKLAILANEEQKKEWLSKPAPGDVQLAWATNLKELTATNADAYFDLLFQNESKHLQSLLTLRKPVFINEVIYDFHFLLNGNENFSAPLLRLNAWPTFLKRPIVEFARLRNEDEAPAFKIFSTLGWKCKSVPDVAGLVSARIIAMIVNEAYFTLQDEVSTKQEIDIAMKLGTNYPYGPFEWSELIGLQNIYRLLVEMSQEDAKYQPAELLKKETEQQAAWH